MRRDFAQEAHVLFLFHLVYLQFAFVESVRVGRRLQIYHGIPLDLF